MSRASKGWVASRCQRRLPTGFRSRGHQWGSPSPETAAALAPWSVHMSPAPAAAEACSECAWAWPAGLVAALGRQRGPRKNHWLQSAQTSSSHHPTTSNQASPPCHVPFQPSKSHENRPRRPVIHQNVSSTLAHHRSCDRHRRRRCCGHPRYAYTVAPSRTPTTQPAPLAP